VACQLRYQVSPTIVKAKSFYGVSHNPTNSVCVKPVLIGNINTTHSYHQPFSELQFKCMLVYRCATLQNFPVIRLNRCLDEDTKDDEDIKDFVTS